MIVFTGFVIVAVSLAVTQGSFSSQPLLVSTIYLKPYLEKVPLSDGNVTHRGYIKDLMDQLAEGIGFKYEFVQPADEKFGYRFPNGTWTGTINEIVNNNVDIIAGPLTATPLRSEVVDFSQPFQTTGAAIVLKNPEDLKEPIGERLTKILQPFESSVWLLICMSFMVTGTVMYIISYSNPYEWRRMARDSEATLREGESFTCMNSFWFVVSAFAWQGYTRAPRSIGGRTVVLSWWFFTIVVISCYIANLSNLLRIGSSSSRMSKEIAIKSLEDLAYSKIPFAISRGGSMQEFLKNSNLDLVQQLHDDLHAGRGKYVDSVQEGIQKVVDRNGQFAFITESYMAKYLVEKLSCQLYIVSDYTIIRQYCLGFQKNSTFIDKFNTRLLKLQESGKLAALEEKWFTGECKNFYFERGNSDYKYEIPVFYAMELGHFSGALLVLAIGLVAGGIITVVEFFIFRLAETDSEHDTHAQDKKGATGNAEQHMGATDTLLSDKEKASTTV